MKLNRSRLALLSRLALSVALPSVFAFGSIFSTAASVLAQSTAHTKTHAKYTEHNIAILIDTSAHMSMMDRECGKEQLTCLLAGVRILLSKLYPCQLTEATCGPAADGGVVDPVDTISVFVFPNVKAGERFREYDCTGSGTRNSPYTFPQPGAESYSPGPSDPSYQIIDFSSDYRSADTDPELNPDSNLVKALGGRPDCPSLSHTGGFGTYYAGAIYAAQASLIAQRKARPRSKNVMIVIGDGDSQSTRNQMQPRHGEAPSVSTDSGAYPSWVNECGQAITAARAATAAGTKVYSIAYNGTAPYAISANVPPLRGCPTDTFGFSKGISGCATMKGLATSSYYFFSAKTTNAIYGPCTSTAHPNLNLDQIFTQIGNSLQPHHRHPKPKPQ